MKPAQFQVSPDFRDIPKFTGVTRARNYEIFRERLRQAGMLDQAHDFVRASGALRRSATARTSRPPCGRPAWAASNCSTSRISPARARRWSACSMCSWNPRDSSTPEKWRQFCCETVPLLRMEKYTWTSDETFIGTVQVAHYGPADFPDAAVTATVTDGNGKPIAAQRFRSGDDQARARSSTSAITRCRFPHGINRAAEADAHARHRGNPLPQQLSDLGLSAEGRHPRCRKGVMVTRQFLRREATRKHLAAGGKVLLLPKLDKLPHSVPGGFQTRLLVADVRHGRRRSGASRRRPARWAFSAIRTRPPWPASPPSSTATGSGGSW